jgi:3-oxoacyl-[acyl-carrier protein] reductase
MLDGVSRMTPLGRAGKPEEAAGAVYLFCTPESNFLSGQVVYCGGGPGGNF